eukprot:COSAG02_NODE_40767_length_401_cov_1.781457_1_plen_41_part_10
MYVTVAFPAEKRKRTLSTGLRMAASRVDERGDSRAGSSAGY